MTTRKISRFVWLRPRNGNAGQLGARIRRRVSLRLECLDERIVPTVINVNSTADIATPPPGVITLREAIHELVAPLSGNGGCINLTVPGDYKLTMGSLGIASLRPEAGV